MNDHSLHQDPLERIAHLEERVAAILCQRMNLSTADFIAHSRGPALWSADELLLLRCLKRIPEILSAYRRRLEIMLSTDGRLEILESDIASIFEFIEFTDGSALVIINEERFYATNATNSDLRVLFDVSDEMPVEFMRHNVIKLPYFLPIERGRRWVLQSRGSISKAQLRGKTSLADTRYEIHETKLRDLISKVITHETQIQSLMSDMSQLRREVRYANNMFTNDLQSP